MTLEEVMKHTGRLYIYRTKNNEIEVWLIPIDRGHLLTINWDALEIEDNLSVQTFKDREGILEPGDVFYKAKELDYRLLIDTFFEKVEDYGIISDL